MKLQVLSCCTLLSCLALLADRSNAADPSASASQIPHLQKQGATTQLIVDGKPFLVLTGELEDSTSTSLENLRRIWPSLVEMNLNTVFPVVYWGLLEPEEGRFDFALVNGMLELAQQTISGSAWCGLEVGRTACRFTPRSG